MTSHKPELTAAQVRELLAYDPATGILTWKPRPVRQYRDKGLNTRYAGKPAGMENKLGYLVVGVKLRLYYAHRLAWAIMTGAWPDGDIDHIDGDTRNNVWSNLRTVTKAQNNRAFKKERKRVRDLPRGVYPNGKKFRASIKDGEKELHLGSFGTPEEASRAFRRKANELRGDLSMFRNDPDLQSP